MYMLKCFALTFTITDDSYTRVLSLYTSHANADRRIEKDWHAANLTTQPQPVDRSQSTGCPMETTRLEPAIKSSSVKFCRVSTQPSFEDRQIFGSDKKEVSPMMPNSVAVA